MKTTFTRIEMYTYCNNHKCELVTFSRVGYKNAIIITEGNKLIINKFLSKVNNPIGSFDDLQYRDGTVYMGTYGLKVGVAIIWGGGDEWYLSNTLQSQMVDGVNPIYLGYDKGLAENMRWLATYMMGYPVSEKRTMLEVANIPGNPSVFEPPVEWGVDSIQTAGTGAWMNVGYNLETDNLEDIYIINSVDGKNPSGFTRCE